MSILFPVSRAATKRADCQPRRNSALVNAALLRHESQHAEQGPRVHTEAVQGAHRQRLHPTRDRGHLIPALPRHQGET